MVDPDELLRAWLDRMRVLKTPAERRLLRIAATRDDPLLFALIYLRRHLKSKAGVITLSEVHEAWLEAAEGWLDPVTRPYQSRRAEVAPRDTGKSTWFFLLLPMWGAAHGHIKFAAAFANTPEQAETHLATFKSELDNNPLLREDYPDLVAPRTRGRGTTEADRVSLYHARSGFVFAASGMDSSNLGLKVGNLRPDLIVLDDIEPHEGRYSSAQAAKRLDTLLSAILPLNIYARVIVVGTVTMVGSIVHQLVESIKPGVEVAPWIIAERFTAHHYPAIAASDDGSRRSIWPAKWALEFLESIEGSRSYAKNYANDPLGADGDYWRLEDIKRGDLPACTRVALSLDPNVTQKASSDYSGLAVVGWQPAMNGESSRCVVRYARQVKQDPATLRLTVLALVEEYGAGLVIVETNQGGDLWLKILWGLPVKVKTIHQHEAKEVRAAAVLNHYQRGRVLHVDGLTSLEGQLVAFPNAPNDDMVDAVGTAVNYFLTPRKPKRAAGATVASYA